jgi:uncharacterized protein YndB with AHSA1/START domain
MEQTTLSSREIIHTRIFNTTREIVFSAWTDPAQLAQWWGPNGFTNTFHTFELRPGGRWDFTMHDSEGQDFHNQCVFIEITCPERIVFKHLLPVHEFILTATFEYFGEKTRLTFCQRFETAEEIARLKSFLINANEQNLDRLEALITNPVNPHV